MPKRFGEKKREDQKRENCMNQRKQNLSNPRVLDSPQMLINNSDPEPFRQVPYSVGTDIKENILTQLKK